MKIGACYIRVSTADQTEYSPESQLRMIKEYAEKNDIAIPEEYIYRDEGISGRTAEKRPAFQEMVTAARHRYFEAILIYSTSRFARNHEQSIVYRSMLERECGVEVISITQPNVDKKTDMLTNAIYSIMDEWYSLDLSDNVRRGMTEKALKGEYQTSPPFGYELKHPKDVMTIREDEAKIVRYVFEQFLNNNKSVWAIARDLKDRGIKSKRGRDIDTRSLIYILRNPVYKGYSRWTPTTRVYWDFKNKDTIIAKGKHEAIIEEAMFDDVQKKLDERELTTKAGSRPQETLKHWLSGLIKCSSCGQTLNYNGVTPKRKNACFRCGGYARGSCRVMSFITVADAEKNVIGYLAGLSSDINVLYDSNVISLEADPEQIGQINAEIKKLNNKLERAKRGFLNGIFELEEYKAIKKECDARIAELQEKISGLSNTKIDYTLLQKDINNVHNVLTSGNFDRHDKQVAVRSLIEKIVIDRKTHEFRIYFYR